MARHFNPAHEALLILLRLIDSGHCSIIIGFVGGQQSNENSRTPFDHNFCHSSHGKTDRILRQTFGRKLFKILLRILVNFHDVQTCLLSSLPTICTLGCLPISVYFILLTFGPGRRGDLCQHSHIGHGRPVVAVGGNWLNQPVTI